MPVNVLLFTDKTELQIAFSNDLFKIIDNITVQYKLRVAIVSIMKERPKSPLIMTPRQSMTSET